MIPMSANWIEEKNNKKNPQGSSTGRIYANIILYNPAQIAQVSIKMLTNISSTINQNQVVNYSSLANLI